MKNIAVLGSTGSIGRQTLEVAVNMADEINVTVLTADKNIPEIENQIRRFNPAFVCVGAKSDAELLRKTMTCKVMYGAKGLAEAAAFSQTDVVVNALPGTAGLLPSMAALTTGKTLALANKETLVAAGELVTEKAKSRNTDILPIDSEHSAIWQCLESEGRQKALEKIYLTASGGPFRGKKTAELKYARPSEALRHPNWNMGQKITIDSATLMNKGLEVIEARWLFNVSPDDIEVLVHPQSIIHSMVGFADGAVIAQLGMPDMRVPIQYALTYPERRQSPFPRPDFLKCGPLTFEPPDLESFPCLGLAYEALRRGGLAPAVMNAANESAVALFLAGKIRFTRIPALIEKAIFSYTEPENAVTIENVLAAGKWAADYVSMLAE